MKKIILILSLAVLSCEKPKDPTPTVDYSQNFVGSYVGTYNSNVGSSFGRDEFTIIRTGVNKISLGQGKNGAQITASTNGSIYTIDSYSYTDGSLTLSYVSGTGTITGNLLHYNYQVAKTQNGTTQTGYVKSKLAKI